MSLLHAFVFTSFFVFVSYISFSPTHHFSGIFNAVISNQLYIAFLFYGALPFIYHYRKSLNIQAPKTDSNYTNTLRLKDGDSVNIIPINEIQYIKTNKPYVTINLLNKRFLENRSLKDFELLLNPETFIRVHRSSIVNKNAIKTITSRKNGDYDAVLFNGHTIRFSRHFRNSWQHLLH